MGRRGSVKEGSGFLRTSSTSTSHTNRNRRVTLRDEDPNRTKASTRSQKELDKHTQSFFTAIEEDEELEQILKDPSISTLLANMQIGDTPSPGIEDDVPPAKEVSEKIKQLQNFLLVQERLLQRLMIRKGPGFVPPNDLPGNIECSTCGEGKPCIQVYRCRDCYDKAPLCGDCMRTSHAGNPFHNIEAWTGKSFRRAALADTGLGVQVGHRSCPNPKRHGRQSMTVVHLNGIHNVPVTYCGCVESGERWIQLVDSGLWPTSYVDPRTVFTWECLDLFRRLNLNGKLTAHAFYHAITSITDNTGTRTPKSKLAELSETSRLFRYIINLEQAGRGNAESGIAGTKPGELAQDCPACPHPFKNLPTGWNADLAKRWLYTLFLSNDGNYRVKLKNRHLSDIALIGDWGYFVNQGEYEAYIKEHKGEEYLNFCDSKLHAVDHANKRSRSFKYMGIFACKCGRHVFARPNGVGDLPRGEAQACADFVTFSTARLMAVVILYICYDIMCSYVVKLAERRSKFPPSLALHPNTTILRVAIPDFHLEGHGPKCQTVFNLLRILLSARNALEGIETSWADTNKIGPSVQEMSEEGRRELLGDHFGWWNWEKIKGFGPHLLTKFKEAIEMRDEQKKLYDEFTAAQTADQIKVWQEGIDAFNDARNKWEAGGHQPKDYPKGIDPYQYTSTTRSLHDVQQQLEVAESVEPVTTLNGLEVMSPSRWLAEGMDIEHSQRHLKDYIKTAISSNGVASKFEARAIAAKRKTLSAVLDAWIDIQAAYLPHSVRIQTTASSDPLDPEEVPLLLPSAVFKTHPSVYTQDLIEKEVQLRVAQADDSLDSLRTTLGVRRHLFRYKEVHVHGTGQKSLTRARTCIAQYTRDIKRFAETYRVAREAIIALRPDDPSLAKFLQLREEDLRFPSAPLEEIRRLSEEFLGLPITLDASASLSPPKKKARKSQSKTGQSRENVPWIWTTGRQPLDVLQKEPAEYQAHVDDDLRVEWGKAQSRTLRWGEEVELLSEEMRRVVVYSMWKSWWWWRHTLIAPTDALAVGRRSYAWEQADMWVAMARRCVDLWVETLQKHGQDVKWADIVSVPIEDLQSVLPPSTTSF